MIQAILQWAVSAGMLFIAGAQFLIARYNRQTYASVRANIEILSRRITTVAESLPSGGNDRIALDGSTCPGEHIVDDILRKRGPVHES